MDERQRRASRRATADPADEEAQERVHQERLRRGDHKDYAKELRRRVNEGDTHHRTTQHYIETLHKAHPEITDHFDRWARHDEAHDKSKGLDDKWNREHSGQWPTPRSPHHKEIVHHRGEANSAREKGEGFAHVAGHRSVYFLRPHRFSNPTMREAMRHLSRMHDLTSAAHQGSASYKFGTSKRAELIHYHDEWPHGEARETAEIHAGVVKYHFPNAKVSVREEGPNGPEDEPHDRHSVHISDLHKLKSRSPRD